MKNQKVCFSRSFVFVFLSILILGTFTILSIKLLQTRTSNSTRASAPTVVDSICTVGYNNAGRCATDCKKYYSNRQCTGNPALHCCTVIPTPSPIPTKRPGPLGEVTKFNLTTDQMTLLKAAGFTPINYVPPGLPNLINMANSSNYYVNEEGLEISVGGKWKIPLNVTVNIIGGLMVSPNALNSYYNHLVEMYYTFGTDKEYLISFYSPKAEVQQYYTTFKEMKGGYYETNIASKIPEKNGTNPSPFDSKKIYFPITTQFLACQENNRLSSRINEACVVFGYKQVATGYEFEYFYLLK